MKLIRTWCENTKERMEYFTFIGYSPVCRLSNSLWLVAKIGNKLDDVKKVKKNCRLKLRFQGKEKK